MVGQRYRRKRDEVFLMASAHAKISYVKSAIRIVGYLCFFAVDRHPMIWLAAVLLIVAEIIGIVEEIGY